MRLLPTGFLLVSLFGTIAHGAEPKILIIGIDGLRPDCLAPAGPLPALTALKSQAAWTNSAQTITHTVSGPAWTSILTGVSQERHRIFGNNIDPSDLTDCPSLFFRFRAVNPTLTTAAISSWKPQTEGILKSGAQEVQTFVDYDNESVTKAAEVLFAKTKVPDLTFVGFDDPDHTGHKSEFAPTSKPYLEMIRTIDGFVGRIMSVINRRPTAKKEDWVVVVISDHGGKGNHHGDNTPEERTVPFWICGPAKLVERGEIQAAVQTYDLAPTLAAIFRIPVDPAWHWEGQARGLKGLKPTAAKSK